MHLFNLFATAVKMPRKQKTTVKGYIYAVKEVKIKPQEATTTGWFHPSQTPPPLTGHYDHRQCRRAGNNTIQSKLVSDG